MKYYTQTAHVHGAIVGTMWIPAVTAGIPGRWDIRAQRDRFSEKAGTTFRDILLHILMENGGDFQNAEFAADSCVRIERRCNLPDGSYCVHVRERLVSDVDDCADLVNADVETCDIMSSEEN